MPAPIDKIIASILNNDAQRLIQLIPTLDDKSLLNSYDKKLKQTPLMMACSEGNFEIAQILIESGAEIGVEDRGYSAFDMAKIWSQDPGISSEEKEKRTKLLNAFEVKVQDYIIELSKKMDEIECLIILKDAKKLEVFLNKFSDKERKNLLSTSLTNGSLPLWLAFDLKNVEIINLLIKAGADVNYPNCLRNESTLLMNICESFDPRLKDQEILNFLIEHGADIEAKRRSDGMTPLMLATRAKKSEAIKFLNEKIANKNFAKEEEKAVNYLKSCVAKYYIPLAEELQTNPTFKGENVNDFDAIKNLVKPYTDKAGSDLYKKIFIMLELAENLDSRLPASEKLKNFREKLLEINPHTKTTNAKILSDRRYVSRGLGQAISVFFRSLLFIPALALDTITLGLFKVCAGKFLHENLFSVRSREFVKDLNEILTQKAKLTI